MMCLRVRAGSLVLHLEAFWSAVIRWVYDPSTVDEAMQGLIAAFEIFCACLHRPLLQQNMGLTDAKQPTSLSVAIEQKRQCLHQP